MKAVYSYETSVADYKTRWSQNPKDHNSNNFRRENLKTYIHAYFTLQVTIKEKNRTTEK